MKTSENETCVVSGVGAAILAAFVVYAFTGCAYGRAEPPKGYMKLEADAEGLRAYNDGLNALVTNGKASPDQKTHAWMVRENQEKEITERVTTPMDFLQMMVGQK